MAVQKRKYSRNIFHPTSYLFSNAILLALYLMRMSQRNGSSSSKQCEAEARRGAEARQMAALSSTSEAVASAQLIPAD
jgi:hypothetical protein